MNKKIALTIQEMKKLESLGLDTSDASMYWYFVFWKKRYELRICDDNTPADKLGIPAYTLQDVLDKLPREIEFKGIRFFLWWSGSVFSYSILDENGNYKGAYHEAFDHNGDSILEGAYDMLLWCIENNYIKTNKL